MQNFERKVQISFSQLHGPEKDARIAAMVTDRALSFLYGRHVERCREDFQKTYEDYCTVQYCARGTLFLQIDQEIYTVREGQMWSMRPPRYMRIHPLTPDECWDHRYIAFRGHLTEHWIADGLLPPEPVFVPKRLEAAGQFDLVTELIDQRDRWSRLRAVNVLESLLIQVRQSRAAHAIQETDWFEEAVRTLSRFRAWPVDFTALAQRLGMSVATLRRRFHETTGMSPHHYALGMRVAEAKRFLTDTSMSMGEIAEQLGYRDIYFFSRQFRRFVGTAPSTFRKNFARASGCLPEEPFEKPVRSAS